MKKRTFGLIAIFWFVAQGIFAQSSETKFIPFTNKSISYMGRIGKTDSCTELYWTGSSIQLNVQATKTVKALLSDDKDGDYYYVIIDGNGNDAVKIKVDKNKKLYTLASNLTADKHHIELFKVTNTDYITTRFFGFEIDQEAKVLTADKLPKRKIEFFGNSITCGHSVEDNSNDSGLPQFCKAFQRTIPLHC